MRAYLQAGCGLFAEIVSAANFRGERGGECCSGGGGFDDGKVLCAPRRLDDHAVEYAGPPLVLVLGLFGGDQLLEQPPPLLLVPRAQKLVPLRRRVNDCNRKRGLVSCQEILNGASRKTLIKEAEACDSPKRPCSMK